MAGFNEFKERVENLDEDAAIMSAMEKSVDAIADANVEQLFKGQSSAGRNLMSYKDPEYAAYKNRLNPLAGYGNPDLRLTGDYYRGFYAKLSGDNVESGSNDFKAQFLEKHYGADNIYGLNDLFIQEVTKEVVGPNLIGEMRERLSL